MNKSYLFLIASVLSFLSLAGGVSAGEETVSISVDVPMRGNYADETTNVSRVLDWHSMDIALGEDFTFTFIADNLVNGTEYTFSYEILAYGGQKVVETATHLFVANNTGEYSYNLEGQFNPPPEDAWSNCSKRTVKVSFVKDPNGLNETLETFQTDFFYPSGFIYDICYPCLHCNDDGYLAFWGLIIALPLLFLFSIYKMFKLSVQDGDDGTWAALFWLTMMVLPFLIFSYFWVVPW